MEGQDECDILLEACRITEGSRKEMYGAPEDNLARIADLWSVILKRKVEPKEVALCMIALKLARSVNSTSRDSWVDIAGYARVGWMCDGKP